MELFISLRQEINLDQWQVTEHIKVVMEKDSEMQGILVFSLQHALNYLKVSKHNRNWQKFEDITSAVEIVELLAPSKFLVITINPNCLNAS